MSCLVQHLLASTDAFKGGENPFCYDLERFKMLEIACAGPTAVMAGAGAS